MNIRTQLEAGHSKATTSAIVTYVGQNKRRLSELMQLVLTGDQDLAPWAAWPMSYIAEQHPQLFDPWVSQLLERLAQPGLHPGLYRNILRAFESIDIPADSAGRAVDLFFAAIADPKQPHAVRAFAITGALRVCSGYPELMAELRLLLVPLAEQPQPASLKVRLRRALQPERKKAQT